MVIDASVAVKWYRYEADSDLAEQLLSAHAGGFVVPDLFAIEVTAALVRHANAAKFARAAMRLWSVRLGRFSARSTRKWSSHSGPRRGNSTKPRASRWTSATP